MNIVVSSNENYVKSLKIMLLSLFKNNKKCNIYLLYSNITNDSMDELKILIESNGCKLMPVFIDKNIFNDFPDMGRISKEAYYRLLVSDVLPKELDRVLYLDTDILIRGSLENIYKIEFEGNLIAAVIDNACDDESDTHLKRIGINRPYHYVNSGVILFNLIEMRKYVDINDMFSLLSTRDDWIFVDQEILNIYFKGKIKYIDNIYNFSPFYGKNEKNKEPIIVHFIGKNKPWNKDYCFRFCFEYNSYMRKLGCKEDYKLYRFRFLYFIRSFAFYIYEKIINIRKRNYFN